MRSHFYLSCLPNEEEVESFQKINNCLKNWSINKQISKKNCTLPEKKHVTSP